MAAHALTVQHGDDLAAADFATLATVRRTLLGLLEHGCITELDIYASSTETTWSYRRGTEDPGGIMAGIVDLVRALEPGWPFRVDGPPLPGADAERIAELEGE